MRQGAAASLVWQAPFWSDAEAAQDPENNFKVRGLMYVDDLAIPRLAAAAKMDRDVKGIKTITHQTFAEFRFELNYGPGKTRVLIRHGGARATAARARLAKGETQIILEVCDGDGKPIALKVVDSYEHLAPRRRHSCR